MILNSTKYKNPQRTISGLLNVVSNADTIILCNTSVGAVAIELLEIPFDQWSTTYKVFIVDSTNNAGTNNITITAPSGFTINNQSSLIINTNGGSVTVTVASNTGYLGSATTGSGGGGNDISIANEGVEITPAVESINFVGSLVTATAVGSAVTVTINPNFVVVNYTQLQTLISTNTLIPAQQYLISNAKFINTTGQITFVPIVVEAVSTNELEISGAGFFQNADYQGVGNYSGVPTYVENKGTWLSGGTYVVGDVVIYNNLQYLNITGSNTGNPATTPADWTFLPKATMSWINTSTNGYITEIDIIKYNAPTNQITYREDVRFNRIDNNLQFYSALKEAFYVFQWGNDFVRRNTVQNESYLDCLDNVKTKTVFAEVQGNTANNFSLVTISNRNVFNFNTIENESFLSITNLSTIKANQFTHVSVDLTNNGGNFNYNQLINAIAELTNINEFTQNTLKNLDTFRSTNGGVFTENVLENLTNYRIDNNDSFKENNFFTGIDGIVNNGRNFDKNTISFTNNFLVNNETGNFQNNNVKNTDIFTISVNSATFNNNFFDKGSLNMGSIEGDFTDNTVLKDSNLTFTTTLVGQFSKNIVDDGSIIEIQDLGSVINENTFFNASLLIVGLGVGANVSLNNFKYGIRTGFSTIYGGENSQFVNNNILFDHPCNFILKGVITFNTFEYGVWDISVDETSNMSYNKFYKTTLQIPNNTGLMADNIVSESSLTLSNAGQFVGNEISNSNLQPNIDVAGDFSLNVFFNTVTTVTFEVGTNGYFRYNNFQNCTNITVLRTDGVFESNVFTNVTTLDITNSSGITVSKNTIIGGTFILGQNSSTILGNSFENCLINLRYNQNPFQLNKGFDSTLVLDNGNNATFQSNIFNNCSSLTFHNCNGEIQTNTFLNCNLLFDIYDSSVLKDNTFENITDVASTQIELFGTSRITDNVFRNIFNQFQISNKLSGLVVNNNFENCSIYIVENYGSFNNNFCQGDETLISISTNNGTILQNQIIRSGFTIQQNDDSIENNQLFNCDFIISSVNRSIFESNILNNSNITINTIDTNAVFKSNILNDGSSITINTNFAGRLVGNELRGGAITIPNFDGSGELVENTITQSSINIAVFNGILSYNQILNGSSLIIGTNYSIGGSVKNNFWNNTTINISGGLINKIEQTWCEKANLTVPSINQDIERGIFQRNVGTIQYTLDLADKSIYDTGTKILTIPPAYASFFGEYWLTNGAIGNPIDYITGLSESFATKFVSKSPLATIVFTSSPVATAVATEIIGNILAPHVYPITARTNGEDSIYIRALGNLNGIEQYYLYL
jgi:hypothetical protein